MNPRPTDTDAPLNLRELVLRLVLDLLFLGFFFGLICLPALAT